MNKELLGTHIVSKIDKYSPCYFISIQYNIFDNKKKVIKDRVDKLYDAYSVFDTHKHINNLLRDAFDRNLMMWWFMERNKDFIEDGKIIRGYYHSHLILETIQDHIFDEPNRTLKKVYYQSPNPIINRLYYNDQERHYDLITEVLKRSYWLKNAPENAIDIQPIHNLQSLFIDPERPNYGYLLKQISQEGINTIIDKENSSF